MLNRDEAVWMVKSYAKMFYSSIPYGNNATESEQHFKADGCNEIDTQFGLFQVEQDYVGTLENLCILAKNKAHDAMLSKLQIAGINCNKYIDIKHPINCEYVTMLKGDVYSNSNTCCL